PSPSLPPTPAVAEGAPPVPPPPRCPPDPPVPPQTDVFIAMELMGTCAEKLKKRIQGPIPERILGKMTVAIVKALLYLKEKHGVIHRDVKPSNILLDERGQVKLCDFGISGRLVDSKAKTRSAGCAAYMNPPFPFPFPAPSPSLPPTPAVAEGAPPVPPPPRCPPDPPVPPQTDVFIAMELMGTCAEKLKKRIQGPIPERILGKMTVAIVKALLYLKEKHGVIHRDVKPSNILLDERGQVKLCDFGISGRLVDSKAKTRSAGCAAYM
ncbi:protein kinase wis1-like, partial [Corapipo altera]|uniref:protein kinase wis1-like n=1 Tax=Corapipo altera TaxID=415028 RepID=UPI000FD659DF